VFLGSYVILELVNEMDTATVKIGYELKMVLDQEVSLLENLLDVMRRENQLLTNSDTRQVFELNKSKELLILQHSYVDRNRRDLVVRLAEKIDLKNSEPNLEQLSGVFEEKLGSEIRSLNGRMKAHVDEIQLLSTENSALIECSIRAVKDSWAMLKRQFFDKDARNSRHPLPADGKQEEGVLIHGRI